MEEHGASIETCIPAVTITIETVGTNSLLGALCKDFIDRKVIRDIGVINPDSITFIIKSVHYKVNLYDEINKVRDILKIPEGKISVIISQDKKPR